MYKRQNLAQSYDDGFNTVSNVFLDLPGIMNGLNNMFFVSVPSINGQLYVTWYQGQVAQVDSDKATTFKQSVIDSYNLALTSYNTAFDTYKSTPRTADHATVESLIKQTYDTTKLIADAIKNSSNYLDFVSSSMQSHNFNLPAIITTHQTILNSDTSKTNSDLTNLLSTQTNIKNDKDAFPSTNLDLQSSELSVTQKQNALQDAKNALADYYVYAPFDGTIASVPVVVGDSASSTLGTIITSQQVAVMSLNEVDVAKLSLGQKATLTFDAVPDLTITGKVVQIDSIGTVSSGVVNYNVKISFDTNDSRVKPGMSVNATIITNIKQNVLTVANSAVKTLPAQASQNETSYVETFDTALSTPLIGVQGSPSIVLPIKKDVLVGISNDTVTEISSGVKEGDIIVTKTITGTSTTKTTSTKSILGGMSSGPRN